MALYIVGGNNYYSRYGVLGVGNTNTQIYSYATAVKDENNSGNLGGISAIYGGGYQMCAIKSSDGSVLCWGDNSWGQLGNGGNINTYSYPTVVKGTSGTGSLTGINRVVLGGGRNGCAFNNSGNVYCWGLAITSILPETYYPAEVTYYPSITDIALSGYQAGGACLVSAGTVYCGGPMKQWVTGSATWGAVAAEPGGSGNLTGVTRVINGQQSGAAAQPTCVLKNGSVYCWGYLNHAGLGTSAASNYTPARTIDSTGVAGSGPYLTSVESIVPGFGMVFAVKSDGTISAWGENLGDIVTQSDVDTQIYTPVKTKNSATAGDYLNFNYFSTSGTFTSSIIDLGNKVTALTPTFSVAASNGTSISVSLNGKVNSGDGFTSLGTVTSGNAVSGAAGKRYFQYVATLSADGTRSYTPSFDSMSLTYSYYGNSGPKTLLHLDSGNVTNGSAITDSSGYSVAATLSNTNGSGAAYSSGKISNALTFDGTDDYISLPDTAYNFNGAFTIEAWIKGTSFAGAGSANEIVSRADGTTNAALLLLEHNGNNPNQIRYLYKVNNVAVFQIYSNPSISTGNWYHIVASYNPSLSSANASIYINGERSTSTANATTIGPINGYFNVGSFNNAGNMGRYWNGQMDEVAIYNRALSADEIAYHYNAGSPAAIAAGMQPAFLVSSIYDSNSSANILGTLTSFGSLGAANTSVSYQIRSGSSSDPVANAADWKNWCGSSGCDGASTFAFTSLVSGGQTIAIPGASPLASSTAGNRYFQYRILLNSDGQYTPTVGTTTIQYVVNEPPAIEVTNTVSQLATTTGKVQIDYDISDVDAATGSNYPNTVQLTLQYCTANCNNPGSETWGGTAGAGSIANYDSSWSATGTIVYATTSSSTYHMIWTPDYVVATSSSFKIKLIANDREGANNTSNDTSNVFAIDSKAPTKVSPAIVVDPSSANPLITLNASDENTNSPGLRMNIWIDALFDYTTDSITNGATWLAYNSTSTLDLSAEPEVIYAAFRDPVGNLSTASTTLPEKVIMTMVQDTSYVIQEPKEYRLFLAWKRPTVFSTGNGFRHYNIYRSASSTGPYSVIATSGPMATNYWTDTTMASGTDLYYKVAMQDVDGNVAYLSASMWGNADGTQNAGEGGGGSGAGASAPPAFSNVSTTTYTTQATVAWDTNMPADSIVEYTTNNDGTFSDATSTGISTMYNSVALGLGRHSVTLSGLLPATTYYLKIKSTNAYGAQATTTQDSLANTLFITTDAGPSISNIASSTTNTTATITWDTDAENPSDSYVVYSTSTNPDTGIARQEGDNQSNTSHTVTLSGLTPGTTYYYYVKSGIARDDNTSNYYTLTTTRDLTAPTITFDSNTGISVSDTTTTIVWNTNEAATSTISYGTTNGVYASSSDNINLNYDHSFTLSGLTPNTQYFFRLDNADVNNNQANLTPAVNYFTTLATPDTTAPVIATSSVDVASSTAASVTIQWTTDEPASSFVQYATATSSFDSIKQEAGQSTADTNHSVTITNLSQNQLYYYRVKSIDSAGNESTNRNDSNFHTFSTVNGPAITNVASSTGQTAATISWDVSPNSDGYVIFSTSSDLSGSLEKGNSTRNSSHIVIINSLIENTTYYYKVRSTNAAGGVTTDDNGGSYYTFVTEAAPLSISNVATSTVSDDSAVITWTTSRLADSHIVYGTSTNSYTESQTDSSDTTLHSILITGLASSTTYYYKVQSTDTLDRTTTSTEYSFITREKQYGQTDYSDKLNQINTLTEQIAELAEDLSTATSTNASSSAQITALQAQLASLQAQLLSLQAELGTATSTGAASAVEVTALRAQIASLQAQLDEALNRGGGGMIIIDKTDKNAPAISNIKATEVKAGSAKIVWDTNENSTSFVSYKNGSESITIGQYDSLNKHIVDLLNLKPRTDYKYQVLSSDSSGNLATSQEYSFTTPSLAEQLTAEGKSLEEIQRATQEADQENNQNNEQLLIEAAKKAMEIVSNVASTVSLGTLEATLFSQYDAIDKLANAIPAPIMGGEPGVVTSATTATIAWRTDKESNSLIAYSPENIYQISENKGDDAYLQVVGNSTEFTKTHLVKIVDLKPETTYHYQLRSKAELGPMGKSRDFTFSTKAQTLEITNYTVQNITTEKAIFRWISNTETDSKLIYTPYRGGKLAIEEAKTLTDKAMTTIHEMTVDNFEGGTIYQVELSGKDVKGNFTNKVIETFSTSADDLPPIIFQVQTESALSTGKDTRVQTIISWQTNEPTLGQVFYEKGINTKEEDFKEKSQLESSYTKKHVLVITKFEPGTVYSFRVSALDSAGNNTMSKTYTILTPRQKESVFQLILKNFESTFGWVGKMGR